MEITKEEVESQVKYDPVAGIFVWRERTEKTHPGNKRINAWNAQWAGKKAGDYNSNNHVRIKINSRFYSAAKIVYLIMTGEYTEDELVLIDGDRENLRWDNIELKSKLKEIEVLNSNLDRKAYPGVIFDEYSQRWLAVVNIAKMIQIRLGTFLTAEEATEERERKLKSFRIV